MIAFLSFVATCPVGSSSCGLDIGVNDVVAALAECFSTGLAVGGVTRLVSFMLRNF